MKEVIKILSSDHEVIVEKMKLLESLLDVDPAEGFLEIYNTLIFFEDFLFKSHHKKEEDVLYAWMVGQNENSDNILIQKIIDEHNFFHTVSKEISTDINNFINKKPSATAITIVHELSEFIRKYNDHMSREESFIFEIASGLKITKVEEEKLLKKLKS